MLSETFVRENYCVRLYCFTNYNWHWNQIIYDLLTVKTKNVSSISVTTIIYELHLMYNSAMT